MAALFRDGFDLYGTSGTATGASTYWTSGTPGTIQSPRISGNGFAIRFAAGQPLLKVLGGTADTLIVGFGFRVVTHPLAGVNNILLLNDTGGTNVTLRIDNAGFLSVLRGLTTTLATAAAPLTVGAWYYIEIKVKAHASTGTIEVRVNGTTVITLTGQNTAPISALLTQVQIPQHLAGSSIYEFDDLYVCDTSGAAPLNDFLGELKVVSLLPNGAGDATTWTPSAGQNFECVDNNPPSDAIFVSDATPGNQDLYNFANVAGGTILDAALVIRAQKSDAGARSIKPLCRSGGTTFAGGSQALSTSWLYYLQDYPLDPNTGAAWTLSNLNAAQFGQETV